MFEFKKFIENLWGEIPVSTRKPSDGWPKSNKLSMSSQSQNQGSMPFDPNMKMMKKEDKKKCGKSKR